jgi:hypothetical protein
MEARLSTIVAKRSLARRSSAIYVAASSDSTDGGL